MSRRGACPYCYRMVWVHEDGSPSHRHRDNHAPECDDLRTLENMRTNPESYRCVVCGSVHQTGDCENFKRKR